MKKVYISTPLKEHKFNITDIQSEILKFGVFAFIPPTSPKVDQWQGSRVDKLSIELCDELWVFGPIGRDCTWEIGYAQGMGKRVIFYRSHENKHIINEDWMLFSAPIEFRDINNDVNP